MNQIRPNTKITIDGTEYELNFTHRDFSIAERRLKQQDWTDVHMLGPRAKDFWRGLNDVESVIVDGKSIESFAPDHFSIGVLLYTGLLYANPSLKFMDALALITFRNFWDVAIPLYRAAVEALTGLTLEEAAAREKEAPDEDYPLRSGSGGDSDGRSPDTTSDSGQSPTPKPEETSMNSGTSPLPNSTHSGSVT